MKFDSSKFEFGSNSFQIRLFAAKFAVGSAFRTLVEFERIWCEFGRGKRAQAEFGATSERIWENDKNVLTY